MIVVSDLRQRFASSRARLFDINDITMERTGGFSIGDAGAGVCASSSTGTDVFADIVKAFRLCSPRTRRSTRGSPRGLLQVTDPISPPSCARGSRLPLTPAASQSL